VQSTGAGILVLTVAAPEILAGSLQEYMRAWLVRMRGGNGARPALVAGAPSMLGMMCTCCTAPIVVGLSKQRAVMGSALAFFLGNPVLNPAVIIFMGFVLGWAFAGLRVIFGVAMVALVAYIANKYAVRTGDGDRGNDVNHSHALRDGGRQFNRTALAGLLGQPALHETAPAVWAFGEAGGSRRESLQSLEAPDFTLPDLNGRMHSLSDYRGKVVLLYFWQHV